MTFSEAKFTIRAVNKTQKAFTQINRGIGSLNKKFSKMGGRISKVGALMATVFVGQKFVDVITKFEGLEASLKTVTGSAEIEGYLEAIGNVQFGGAMKEQAGTLKVALSNMEDAFSKLVKAIGDAGLTDLLILIADAIKWLADQATLGVKWMREAFDRLVHSTRKFVNLMIGHFKGLGNYIRQFFIDIGNRFDAFGQDIANFMSDPLSGVSFENTKRAFEVGLVDSMNSGL
jgi:hypothetical protein